MNVADHIEAMDTVLRRARAGEVPLREIAERLRRHTVQVMGMALRSGYIPTFSEMDRVFSEAVVALDSDPTWANLAAVEVHFVL